MDKIWVLNWFSNLKRKPYWFDSSCRFGSFYGTVFFFNITRKIGIWIRFNNQYWKFIICNNWLDEGYIYRGRSCPDKPGYLSETVNLEEPVWSRSESCRFLFGFWK